MISMRRATYIFHLLRSLRVKKPIGPWYPVRRFLLETIICPRLGGVRWCHVVVVVAASKDEEEKDGISFSSSSLPEHRTG